MGGENNVVLHTTSFYCLLFSIRDGNINMPTFCFMSVSEQTVVILEQKVHSSLVFLPGF